MKQYKASAVRWEEGWPAPLLLLKSRGKAAQRVVEAAQSLGIEIREDSFLGEALDLLPEGSFIPEEYFSVMAVILAEVYGEEKR